MKISSDLERKRSVINDRIGRGILYFLLVIATACFVIPFYWLLMTSFKEPSELFEIPIRWMPRKIQFENYLKMFAYIPFMRYLGNTMIVVGANVLGSVLSCSFIAYGFSCLNWKGRDKVFIVVLITMILPFQVVMVPLFLIFHRLGWIGTFLPLTVTSFFGNPFFIFLVRQFFLSLPRELNQAAKIDGAGEFRIFAQIAVPLSRPVLVTVAIFAFLRSWNDFIGPLIFLANDRFYTLSIAALMIRSRIQPNWELLMPLGVVMVVPVLIIFFLMQKHFIQGITMSGIKG